MSQARCDWASLLTAVPVHEADGKYEACDPSNIGRDKCNGGKSGESSTLSESESAGGAILRIAVGALLSEEWGKSPAARANMLRRSCDETPLHLAFLLPSSSAFAETSGSNDSRNPRIQNSVVELCASPTANAVSGERMVVVAHAVIHRAMVTNVSNTSSGGLISSLRDAQPSSAFVARSPEKKCRSSAETNVNVDSTALFESIVVARWLRGRGLGSVVVAACEARARALGFRSVALSTRDASAFYRRLGYTPCTPVSSLRGLRLPPASTDGDAAAEVVKAQCSITADGSRIGPVGGKSETGSAGTALCSLDAVQVSRIALNNGSTDANDGAHATGNQGMLKEEVSDGDKFILASGGSNGTNIREDLVAQDYSKDNSTTEEVGPPPPPLPVFRTQESERRSIVPSAEELVWLGKTLV